MGRYTVTVNGKDFDVDADSPNAAAIAAHQVVNQPAAKPPAPSVAEDAVSGFFQPAANLVHDIGQSYRRKTAEATAPLPSIGEAVSRSAQGLADIPRIAGDVLGLASAPVEAAVRPAARALNNLSIRPYTQDSPFSKPRAMYGEEAQGALESGLNTALQGARPGRLSLPAARAASLAETPVPGRGLTQQTRAVAPQMPVYQRPAPHELRAATAVNRAMSRDAMTPADVVAASKAAPDRLPFEMGGENLKSVAEAAAQVPGPARRILTQKMADRTPQDMRERVVSSMEDALGVDPEAVAGDFAGHAAKLRAAATPLYDAAYSKGLIASDKLEALAKRPSMQAALGRAQRIAAEEGQDPKALGFADLTRLENNRAGSSDVGMVTRRHLTDGWSAKTWDYVKRGLDDVVESYRDPVTRRLKLDEEGRAIVKTLGDVRGELIHQNPAYGEALAAGGEPLRLEEAYRDAPKLMNNGVNERLFGQRWTAASEAQRSAMKGGWANDIFEQARAGRLTLKTLQTPAYRAKLQTMFGDGAADVLNKVVGESRDMQGNHQQMFGNSRTAGRQAAIEDLTTQGADPLDAMASVLDTGLNPMRLSGKALKAGLKAIPRKDRSVIGDQASNEALGKALTDPDEMTRLLNLLEAHRARGLNPARVRGLIGGGVAVQPPLLQPDRRR